jgi:FixJ family two-component response regulator
VACSFKVRTYASGRAFLDSQKTERAACLILDLQMKEEMSGLQVLYHLAVAGLRIPTIIATADDGPGMRHRCELAGAVAFLVKPVMAETLLATIRSATRRKPNQDQLTLVASDFISGRASAYRASSATG